MMSKGSQRFPVQYEKDQSGCMWGLISIFDFRHGRSTRKLIADKRRSSEDAVDAVHSKNKFELLSNLDEDCQGNFDIGEGKGSIVTTDVAKPSVKKLMEDEMFIDQRAMKDIGNAEVESKQSRLGRQDPLKTDSKRKKKSRSKSHGIDSNDLNLDATLKSEFSHDQHSRQQSKDNLDLDKIMEDFSRLKDACSIMHDNDGEVHAQSNQKHVLSENIERDAIHEFVNQMILNGKDLAEARKFLCSHEIMEALRVISSDKELFLKYVQELGNAQGTNDKECNSVAGFNLSEQDLGNLNQTREVVNHKHRNFFRKKSKSQSKSPINKNRYTEFSNRIVILKPAQMDLENSETEKNLTSSLDSHDTVRYKSPSMRVGSHFSFTEIKKKLKYAMGKERHGNSEGFSKKLPTEGQNKGPGGKAFGKDNTGMRSPNKDHFFIEKIARPMFDAVKQDNNGTVKDSDLIVEHENSSYPKQRVSNIYVEAKKHLCEMLGNEDENTDFSSRQFPKTLGKILSLPEYNVSPLGSPGRDWEHHFVTAQKRFSTSDKIWEANQDNLSHVDQATNNPEKQPSICFEGSKNKVQEIRSESDFSCNLGHADTEETCYPSRDEMITEGKVEFAGEINVLESSLEPVGFIAGKDQKSNISEIPDGLRCSQCLNQEVTEENQPSSPLSSASNSSITKKIEELENATDVSGRPSPVSVLDTPYLDDDLSPGYSRFQPVTLPVRPLQIQFEEQDSSPVDQIDRGKYGLEENELIFDYIKAVLQASGLTRDQLLMRCLSSDKILDPSLFDQVEFFSNKLCHDHQLLFDCINEVLMEVCWHYFGVSPWVSSVNPSIRPTPNLKKVILKVWEGVCWHILPLPPPHTLEKIVRKDMAKSGAWMDLRLDVETIGFEMGEAILAELMEDTILSCESEISESKYSQVQFEFKDNESNINV